MMQQRVYFISRYNSTVFKVWGQKEAQRCIRQGHEKISAREYQSRLTFHLNQEAA